MVGSRVSASRTTTSSSEGPLYLSSSARVAVRRRVRQSRVRCFMLNMFIRVMGVYLKVDQKL